uniref:Uncharacterized protein n=1 Tax=Spongospora subterranea TaxID=70186 RepID=A0A0H5QXA9_9EUKA|eukprot:CRZ06628.1 hypothetical protein [Spongospora subterranea]
MVYPLQEKRIWDQVKTAKTNATPDADERSAVKPEQVPVTTMAPTFKTISLNRLLTEFQVKKRGVGGSHPISQNRLLLEMQRLTSGARGFQDPETKAHTAETPIVTSVCPVKTYTDHVDNRLKAANSDTSVPKVHLQDKSNRISKCQLTFDVDRPVFDKLLRDKNAVLGGYWNACKFVKSLSMMSQNDPLKTMWMILSPGAFGVQRVREILMFSDPSVQPNVVVNTLIMPMIKALINTVARHDLTARPSFVRLLYAIWSVPSLYQQIFDAASAECIADMESLIVFLTCSAFCSRSRQSPQDSEHLERLAELLERQGHEQASQVRRELMPDATHSSVFAVEQQLGRHDNDCIDYLEIRIIPTMEEIQSWWRTDPNESGFLPTAHNDVGFLAESPTMRMRDRAFRLVREDMLSTLRQKLRSYTASPNVPKFDKVSVSNFSIDPVPCVELHVPKPESVLAQKEEDQEDYWKRTHWLSKGSLACFIVEDVGVIIGKVVWLIFNPSFEENNGNSHKLMQVSFAVESSIEMGFLYHCIRAKLQGALIHVCTEFFSYEPVLSALQTTMGCPLYDDLAMPRSPNSDKSIRIPKKISFCMFREMVHERISQENQQDCDMMCDWKRLYQNFLQLDQAQRQSFLTAIDRRHNISLIQGPPGTGKTLIGVMASRALLLNSSTRILCICYTNRQLDQFLEALLDAGLIEIVRIGGRSTCRRLLEYNMFQPDTHTTHENFCYNRINDLRGERTQTKNGVFETLHQLEKDLDPTCQKLTSHLDSEMEEFFDDDVVDDDGYVLIGHAGGWIRGRGDILHKIHGEATVPNNEGNALPAKWNPNNIDLRLEKLSEHFDDLRNLEREKDLIDGKRHSHQLKTARIIGCTATGAATYRSMINDAACDVLIIEEAAEILEANVIAALNHNVRKIIMIGDHKQLRPKVSDYRLTVESGNGFDLNRSTFERLILENYKFTSLQTQHRMRPQISKMVRELCYENLADGDVVQNYDHITGLQKDVVFVNHSFPELSDQSDVDERTNSCSKVNKMEAQFVVCTAAYLCQQGYSTENIVILTPYLGQLMEIKSVLKKRDMSAIFSQRDIRELEDVLGDDAVDVANDMQQPKSIRVSTVDNFQGEESLIVLVSLVRSNNRAVIGFLKQKERINVLLSRAKASLIIFGSKECLVSASPIWKNVINGCDVFDGVPIVCPRHGAKSLIKTPEDFARLAPLGGCLVPCGDILKCGHACQASCHDPKATFHAKCAVLVPEICESGHPVQRLCWAKAPKCFVQMIETCGVCASNYLRPCYLPAERASCRQCEIRLAREKRLEEIEIQKVQQFADLMEEQARKLLDIDAENATIAANLSISKSKGDAEAELMQALNQKRRTEHEAQLARQRIAANVAENIRKCYEETEAKRAKEEDRLKRMVNAAKEKTMQIQADNEIYLKESALLAEDLVERCGGDQQNEVDRLQIALSLTEQLRNLSVGAECGVCFDSCKRSDGVICGGSPSHFLCKDCFSCHVASESDCDLALLVKRCGRICCPFSRTDNCSSPPFPIETIGRYAHPDSFSKFLKAQQRLQEKSIVEEYEITFERRVKAESIRRMRLTPAEKARDNICVLLTPSCPRCSQAFIDFDGCCALTCNNCGCPFCAFCLKDCGGDAHAHVAVCPYNPGGGQVFQGQEAWRTGLRRFMIVKIKEYLATIKDNELRNAALKLAEKDLLDCNITLENLK